MSVRTELLRTLGVIRKKNTFKEVPYLSPLGDMTAIAIYIVNFKSNLIQKQWANFKEVGTKHSLMKKILVN